MLAEVQPSQFHRLCQRSSGLLSDWLRSSFQNGRRRRRKRNSALRLGFRKEQISRAGRQELSLVTRPWRGLYVGHNMTSRRCITHSDGDGVNCKQRGAQKTGWLARWKWRLLTLFGLCRYHIEGTCVHAR